MTIRILDWSEPEDCGAFLSMMQIYALDPAGGGKAIAPDLLEQLIPKVQEFGSLLAIAAFDENKVIGLANCIWGFSTFRAKKLLNLHDMIVCPKHRGKGVATKLLEKMEFIAKESEACKLTLEVLTSNVPATELYKESGFVPYELDPKYGPAQFWQKELVS